MIRKLFKVSGLSTESVIAIWLFQYKFLIQPKEFLIKKCVYGERFGSVQGVPTKLTSLKTGLPLTWKTWKSQGI